MHETIVMPNCNASAGSEIRPDSNMRRDRHAADYKKGMYAVSYGGS